jgi:hypothetical protein
VDVAIAGFLDLAIVAEPPPLHDLPQTWIVMDIPGAHLLDKVVVCWMIPHLLAVHA